MPSWSVSQKVNMVDQDILAKKLAELVDRISRVRKHCPEDEESLARDRDALDLVSFNLQLAVQTCLDIASHLISEEGWGLPATSKEAFGRLQEHGLISRGTAQALEGATGLRNLVAHAYGDVVPQKIYEAAVHGLPDLERFAQEVGAWVKERLGNAPA